jgi:ribosomal protein S18 acetylase RimI-like enzyme
MAKINIRKLNSEDLENVLNLFNRHARITKKRRLGFRRRILFSYILGTVLNRLGEDIFIGSIAETANRHMIGTVFARRFPFGKSWVIGPVFLHPSSRGSDIATHLMNFTVEQLRMKKAKLAILSVGKNNIQARRFFEKYYFKYFGPVFEDHDEARKYVRKFTLVSGYLQSINDKMGRYALETKIANSNQKPRRNQIRSWFIMVRKF